MNVPSFMIQKSPTSLKILEKLFHHGKFKKMAIPSLLLVLHSHTAQQMLFLHTALDKMVCNYWPPFWMYCACVLSPKQLLHAEN